MVPFDGIYLTSYQMAMVMLQFSNVYLSELLLEKFDPENSGRSHRLQHSQWSHFMANVNLYKSHTLAFYASSHRF